MSTKKGPLQKVKPIVFQSLFSMGHSDIRFVFDYSIFRMLTVTSCFGCIINSTPPKTNMVHLKITSLKKKIIFQTFILGFKMLVFGDVKQLDFFVGSEVYLVRCVEILIG